MGKGIETETIFQKKLKRLWFNLIKWGVNNPEEFLFVGKFCSSPYITKFTREEVTREYVFLHELMEGFRKSDPGNISTELAMTIFYQSSRAVVSFILESKSPGDTDEIIEEGFRILWNGLAPE